MESILWACGLEMSAVILYNILRFFVKMKRPHDTIGKLNAGLYQMCIIGWSAKNVIYSLDSNSIDNSLIGYYIYDTISLLMTPYGRKQYIYFLHHMLSVFLIYINITYKVAPDIYPNVLYFLMELSASMLNWMKLCNEYYPKIAVKFQLKTFTVYIATRMFCFPVFIIDYSINVYQPVWHQQITVGLLFILYVTSINWFFKMRKNLILHSDKYITDA